MNDLPGRLSALADALNWLAETAPDNGLRLILIHLSNEAAQLHDDLSEDGTDPGPQGLE